MCRMLIAIGKFQIKTLLEGVKIMAEDKNERHEENESVEFKHAHGWGIIYLDGKKLKFFKSSKPCFEDSEYDKFANLSTSFVAIHARRASTGDISYYNTHPFWDYVNQELIGFCHNGTVFESLPVASQYKIQGNVDSERYFYHILSHLNQDNWNQSYIDIIQKIKDYSSINSFLCHRDFALVLNQYTLNPKYYTMKMSVTEDSILISSEILPNLPECRWEKLKNGTLIALNFGQNSLKYSKQNIAIIPAA